MRFKKGDWVYRFIGNFGSPYRCEVVGFGEINTGFWKVKMESRYILQVPGQEWRVYGSDNRYGNDYCGSSILDLFER